MRFDDAFALCSEWSFTAEPSANGSLGTPTHCRNIFVQHVSLLVEPAVLLQQRSRGRNTLHLRCSRSRCSHIAEGALKYESQCCVPRHRNTTSACAVALCFLVDGFEKATRESSCECDHHIRVVVAHGDTTMIQPGFSCQIPASFLSTGWLRSCHCRNITFQSYSLLTTSFGPLVSRSLYFSRREVAAVLKMPLRSPHDGDTHQSSARSCPSRIARSRGLRRRAGDCCSPRCLSLDAAQSARRESRPACCCAQARAHRVLSSGASPAVDPRGRNAHRRSASPPTFHGGWGCSR